MWFHIGCVDLKVILVTLQRVSCSNRTAWRNNNNNNNNNNTAVAIFRLHGLEMSLFFYRMWVSFSILRLMFIEKLRVLGFKTYLLIHSLTHSMQQSPSWDANRFSASQEIPRILWNPKVHYRIHKCPPPVPNLSHIDQVHTSHPTSSRSILILSFHLCLGLPSGLFPSGSPPKPCTSLFPLPHALHSPPILFFSLLSPLLYWVRSTDL